MKFRIFPIWLFILHFLPSQLLADSADTTNYYRNELRQLLLERNKKFDSYSQSLEQRSGIFGNKTKGDIKESNKVLIEIVKTDNHIIKTLNRVVDFRNYEKVTQNYALSDNKKQVDKLLLATDTLSKQVKNLTASTVLLKKHSSKLRWIIYMLLAALLVVALNYVKQKVKKNS